MYRDVITKTTNQIGTRNGELFGERVTFVGESASRRQATRRAESRAIRPRKSNETIRLHTYRVR